VYDLELRGLLRIATGPDRYSYPCSEMEEISATIDAIQQLSERVGTLDKKDRITMLTHGGKKKVWRIESGTLRDRQAYVNKNAVYTEKACGAIEPVPLRAGGGLMGITGISAEELSFLARFI
jgi:hypothetical protein